MKLLTKGVEKVLLSQGDTSQKEAKDIKVMVKYFNPTSAATWWISEMDKSDPENIRFFGYANLGDDDCAELGWVSLKELEEFRGRFNLGIERDLHYTPGKYTLRQIIDACGHEERIA